MILPWQSKRGHQSRTLVEDSIFPACFQGSQRKEGFKTLPTMTSKMNAAIIRRKRSWFVEKCKLDLVQLSLSAGLKLLFLQNMASESLRFWIISL